MKNRIRLPLITLVLVGILAGLYLTGCSQQPKQTIEQWHTLTLDFEGPETSEDAELNPFTDFRLLVKFTNEESIHWIRGFYAADGDASESSATSGNIWQVRFTPPTKGTWTYHASLSQGEMIAIDTDPKAGTPIPLKKNTGTVAVIESKSSGPDFRSLGKMSLKNNYFYFQHADRYWMKGGTDSPENMLGYADFDGTYRFQAEEREGEAKASEHLHTFPTHRADWNDGDPTWKDGKGKALIGGMNYLASKGMNAAYFLTLNIGGDGKDVWPYTDYHVRDRFDVSKLDQWEIVFQHMQKKGILLHVVTQETENETMLDNGDTGPQRKLYYSELIARFGHHLALVWNLGEENGPAEWTPIAQNAEQQKAMATYLKATDPYKHPVLIHTHSTQKHKDHLLPALLGHPPLDGLSFQIDQPDDVNSELIKWLNLAREAGHPWTITMDEIGPWHTGALPDSEDPEHNSIRHKVLWGTLLGGGAGIEWYFGAKYDHHDLNAEDWRSRNNLWEQTQHATFFMDNHVRYWEMSPQNELVKTENTFCLATPGETYVIYAANASNISIDLGTHHKNWSLHWYDPRNGGPLQIGSKSILNGTGIQSLGTPPTAESKDWVALLKAQ